MSTMIERVAKALFAGSIYHGYNEETKRSEWLRTRSIHLAQARRAVEVMREPSEIVVMAGRTEAMVSGMGPRGMKQCYATMIDAILSESPPPASSGRTEG